MQRYSRYICAAPGYYLAVAVFTDYKCVYASAVNAEMLAKKIFKSCGIKHRTRTEYSVAGISAELQCGIGKYVYRICNYKKYSILVSFCYFGDYVSA